MGVPDIYIVPQTRRPAAGCRTQTAVGMFTAVLQRGTPNVSTREALWLLVSIAFSIATCTEATRNPHTTMSGAGRTCSTDGSKVRRSIMYYRVLRTYHTTAVSQQKDSKAAIGLDRQRGDTRVDSSRVCPARKFRRGSSPRDCLCCSVDIVYGVRICVGDGVLCLSTARTRTTARDCYATVCTYVCVHMVL